MSDQAEPVPGFPEDRPVERLERRLASTQALGPSIASALHELAEVDLAIYRAIAATPTPTLDEPLRRLSGLADHSKLWLGVAGVLAVAGGREGRRAAATGVAAVAITSALVNIPMKFGSGRARPERASAGVPADRWVRMPGSTSFPSGHSASGFAFAGAIAGSMPALGVPLRGLAAAVAYSRVHTGVHYPGDVVVGSLVGATVGEATSLAARALLRRRAQSRRLVPSSSAGTSRGSGKPRRSR